MYKRQDVSSARSFADIQHILTDFIQQHHLKEQDWVSGVGYDHTLLKERRHPDADVLRAVGRRPIVITHASSHMGVASYTAMQLANIPPDAPDRDGGRYGRNTDGMLNGYMEENAFTSVSYTHLDVYKRQPQHIIDLVRTGMIQILPLQIYLCTAQFLAHLPFIIQQRRTVRIFP